MGTPKENTGAEYDRAGTADLFGRHFVVRAMESPRDVARIDAWYDELPEADRAAIAREEREHRESAMFLHECAHTLGAVHECDGRWFMSERYRILNGAFSRFRRPRARSPARTARSRSSSPCGGAADPAVLRHHVADASSFGLE